MKKTMSLLLVLVLGVFGVSLAGCEGDGTVDNPAVEEDGALEGDGAVEEDGALDEEPAVEGE